MKNIQRTLTLLTIAASMAACGADKKGKSLGIPPVKPPIDAATPEGLSGNSLGLQACGNESGSPIERLKARVFCPGPGDFRYRLGMVDTRMGDLNRRAEEAEKACVTTAPQIWEPTLPGETSFPMYFSCREDMGNGMTVLFGQQGGYSYVAELQNPGGDNFGSTAAPDMAVLARIDAAGEQVDVWTINAIGDKSNWLVGKANKSTKALEMVLMGSSQGYGVGCGVNLKSNDTLVYVNGIVNDHDFPGSCTGYGDQDQNIDLRLSGACLNGSTLAAQDAAACQTAAINEFDFAEFKYADVAVLDQAGVAKSIVKGTGLPAGIPTFN